jgi:hypothetical protein
MAVINTGASFWAQVAATAAQNKASVPPYKKGTDTVNQKILTKQFWNGFATSACMADFKQAFVTPLGAGTVDNILKLQRDDTFYDLTNPEVAKLTIAQVCTNGCNEVPPPPRGFPETRTLVGFLGNGLAATLNFGAPGPIVLRSGLLNGPLPQLSLAHEVLLHSFYAQTDPNVYSALASKHLYDDNKGSTNISLWMSTDCECTPGAPASFQQKNPCPANTAKWLEQ